jgi:hypothetical protein
MSDLTALDQRVPVAHVYWEAVSPAASCWLDPASSLHLIVVFPSPSLLASYRRAQADVEANRMHVFVNADDLNAWLES